jgi:hypothetical protein
MPKKEIPPSSILKGRGTKKMAGEVKNRLNSIGYVQNIKPGICEEANSTNF